MENGKIEDPEAPEAKPEEIEVSEISEEAFLETWRNRRLLDSC